MKQNIITAIKFWKWELWSYKKWIASLRQLNNELILKSAEERKSSEQVIALQDKTIETLMLVAKASVFRCSGSIAISKSLAEEHLKDKVLQVGICEKTGMVIAQLVDKKPAINPEFSL